MNFKIGDKVIIPSKPDITFSSEPNWAAEMNNYIGKEGVIIKRENEQICVSFGDGNYWWYSLRWFESNTFKVGDKVRIKSHPRESSGIYVRGMEVYDEQVGTILAYDPNDNTYRIQFDNRTIWWYSEAYLESLNDDLEINNLEINNLEINNSELLLLI